MTKKQFLKIDGIEDFMARRKMTKDKGVRCAHHCFIVLAERDFTRNSSVCVMLNLDCWRAAPRH